MATTETESDALTLEDVTVVDVDSHLGTPVEDLLPYFENEPVRRMVADAESRDATGYQIFSETNATPSFRQTKHEHYGDRDRLVHHFSGDPEPKREMMEEYGIDYKVLTPPFSGVASINHDGTAVEFAAAYNRWLADTFFDADGELYPVILIPNQKPDRAAEEIDRWGGEDAVVGAALPASGLVPPAGHEWYDPIYEAAEDNDLVITMHSDDAPASGSFPVQRYWSETFTEDHLFTFPAELMWHLDSMMFNGFPERYPDLQVVMQEAGVEWVAWMAWRMNDHYLQNSHEVPLLDQLPEHYIRRQFSFGTQPLGHTDNQAHLASAFEIGGGGDNFMFSSDHPHPDFDLPAEVFTPLNNHLDGNDVRGVMGENAVEVFGLDE